MTRHSEIAEAQARAALARQELNGSVNALVSRIKPSGLAHQAFSGARKAGWVSVAFRVYRYRATALTVLGLIANLKARKKRKAAEQEATAARREADRARSMALFSPFLSRRGRSERQRKSGRGVSTMTNSLKESAEITRERIRAAADSASERAAHVRETAGERANSAYSYARERGSRIVDRVRERPVTAIIGGLAVGVLAAALIPALRNRSVRAGHAASDALGRYRERATGTLHDISGRLDELGVNREHARETLDKAWTAASDVSAIATSAARDALHRIRKDF
ncbi:hypothetical protein [Tardibacter chloracetimidivorans]|nr:hypothetical protein [Tardibacter chloracetimidivorans]